MGITTGDTKNAAGAPGGPESEREASTGEAPVMTLLGLAVRALLILVVGFVVLLLASLFVVFVTGVAARRLGLPELPVTLTFLGLVALLVLSIMATRIATVMHASSTRLEYALDEAGARVADEVDASVGDLTSTLDDLPVLLVDPGVAPRAGERPRSAPGGGTQRQRRR